MIDARDRDPRALYAESQRLYTEHQSACCAFRERRPCAVCDGLLKLMADALSMIMTGGLCKPLPLPKYPGPPPQALLGFPVLEDVDHTLPTYDIKFGKSWVESIFPVLSIAAGPWPTEIPPEIASIARSVLEAEERDLFTRGFYTNTTSNAPAEDPLTYESLVQMLERIERDCPRLEIQIGKGQMDSFALLAALYIGPVSRLRESMHLPEGFGRLGPNFIGIPIIENEIYPPGVGLLVETRGKLSEPRMLLDWQTGKLQTFTFPKAEELSTTAEQWWAWRRRQ
jgi:hypothetical protein